MYNTRHIQALLVLVLVLCLSCIGVQSTRLPPNTFSMGDVVAVKVTGQKGETGQDVAISVKALRDSFPNLQDVILVEQGKTATEAVPHRWKDRNTITADVSAGRTYLVYAIVPGHLADTHLALCNLHWRYTELKQIKVGLPDKICQVILCAPDMLPAEELFTRFPDLERYRDTWDLGGRKIGGWFPPGPGGVCERCTGLGRPRLIPPPLWICDRPASPEAKLTNAMVVNMMPAIFGDETWQDSEPFLSVHPTNPDIMGGSAFTLSPLGPTSSTAPIYVSQDAGLTWELRDIVPSPQMTGDITLAHSKATPALYTSILRRGGARRMDHLLCNNILTCPLMTLAATRLQPDQPFVQVITVGGIDRIYVGSNDLGVAGGRTATVDVSLDSGGTFVARQIGTRNTSGQDGPSVRPAVANDGTVYAAFMGWRTFTWVTVPTVANVTSDIVVVRDDNGATGATPFRDLVDPSDTQPGMRVATTVPIRWSNAGTLDLERIGSTLSLAVDPNNSDRVYVAWADRSDATAVQTLHVRESTDRGQTWSGDLLTIRNATNVALAVDDRGTLGCLYQQVQKGATGSRWETHLRLRPRGGSLFSDTVLATVPAGTPARMFLPYLGDYTFLLAVGNEFRGVFSANNTPDQNNFPQGVVYQRPRNFATKQLLDAAGNPVKVSIDPFFFRMNYRIEYRRIPL